MAEHQNRRSVSLNKATYERFREHCTEHELTMTTAIDRLLAAEFKLPVRLPSRNEVLSKHAEEARLRRRKKRELEGRKILEPLRPAPRMPGQRVYTKVCCAVCIGDVDGEVRLEPLGRNDALVPVCGGCATKTPRDPAPGEYRYKQGYAPRWSRKAGAR